MMKWNTSYDGTNEPRDDDGRRYDDASRNNETRHDGFLNKVRE